MVRVDIIERGKVKIIKGPNQECVAIRDEAIMLDQVKKAGVRVPIAYATQMTLVVRKSEGNLHRTTVEILLQQLIPGFSVKDLKEKRLSLPVDFDVDNFMKDLEAEVKKLNEVCFHRDLHEGNVMISPDGRPVIIDFGTSVLKSSLSDERLDGTYLEVISQNGMLKHRVVNPKTDFEYFDKIRDILLQSKYGQ